MIRSDSQDIYSVTKIKIYEIQKKCFESKTPEKV